MVLFIVLEFIEVYGICVVDVWKVGCKGVDDGVIIFIVKDNLVLLCKMCIEVGCGLEGVLMDV